MEVHRDTHEEIINEIEYMGNAKYKICLIKTNRCTYTTNLAHLS